MTILQEILSWSQKNLCAWQQDAVARLYLNRTLQASDFDALYALAKLEHGIADPEQRTPAPLAAGAVAAPPVPNRLVQLTGIRGISNVNALADGMELPIAATGLTVIYGENGAGKSGYSRILKRACRARDQREAILPDARKEPGKAGPPSAVFAALVDGEVCDFQWSNSMKNPPEQLSELAIFDTLCARAYIDNQGDFAYAPYGLDILGGLVSVCNTIKDRASAEKRLNLANTQIFSTLAQTATEVGKALSEIPGTTTAADIQKLAAFTEKNAQRLAVLTKALAEADPKQKALTFKLKAKRLSDLGTRIATALGLVADTKVLNLMSLVDASNAAKRAAQAAAAQVQMSGLLPGTGGEEWKTLFEAAKQFALVVDAGHGLHNPQPDTSCPLCQNPLGSTGVERLALFEAFVTQSTEQAAKAARKGAAESYRTFQGIVPGVVVDEALRQEISDLSQELADTVAKTDEALRARHSQVLAACAGTQEWAAIAPLAIDPRAAIAAIVLQLQAEATALDASSDDKARALLTIEHRELLAKSQLQECRAAVLDAITKGELSAKLQACINSISTTGISRKSTELSKTMARQEVADALNAELRSLKVDELRVVMRPESPGGKTQFKLTLELPGGGAPSAILSEGEQRAIAIGMFLAEIRLGGGRGGVVFDDPVSSLDHHRRWEVARRLAVESRSRQVIVFTHDIYFLCILKQMAAEEQASLATRYICRTAAGFGAHQADLPFDAMGTKERVASLRNQQVDLHRVHKAGDLDVAKRLTREVYRQLRLTWERAVEEVLFDGVIQRFAEGIETKRLSRVTVEDSDNEAIYSGMTKCSKFEHDAASTIHLPTPHPDEVKADIDKLDLWRKVVEERKSKTQTQRKKR